MTNFIKNLTNEHVTILTLLNKIKSPKTEAKARNSYLATVKILLAEHFLEEEINLYPKLTELSNKKNNAIETVKEFTTGLDKIGNIITNFFDSYNNQKGSAIESNSDLSKIIMILEVRINKEEKGLYKLYDKLIKEHMN